MRRPVIVSGIGVVSVFGTSHQAFCDALSAGATGIAPVAAFDTRACRTRLAAELRDFQPAAWVPPMKLRRLDRTGVYAVAATKLALEDAGVNVPADGDDSAGVLFGTWTAGGQSTQQFLDALFRNGPTAAPALLFDSTVGNSAAGLTGLEFKLRGPNVTVSHKEASGLAALVGAVDLIREGRASALIAGGVDALFETFYKAHDRFKVMSAEAQPSRRLAPFDVERAGFVMGEGAFAFWVEPEGVRRAARGAILGVAASSAAVPVNSWPDRPAPLARTMRLALEDADVSPEEVDVVYASANATSLDAIEARAIADVFAGASPVVTSLKGALGESGASGSAACAAALLCGAVGTVPPIAGLVEADDSAASLRLAREPMKAPGPVALVNSFASGGALFSLVVRAQPSDLAT